MANVLHVNYYFSCSGQLCKHFKSLLCFLKSFLTSVFFIDILYNQCQYLNVTVNLWPYFFSILFKYRCKAPGSRSAD